MDDLELIQPLLPDIRMKLHLGRIRSNTARVSSMIINDRHKLGQLMSAYRQTPFGVETRLENPLSKPMSVAEVAAKLDEFQPDNRSAFRNYLDHIVASKGQPRWVLPAYDLHSSGLLLLDGNHRAVATYLARRRFVVELRVLHGPLDRRILAPLKYWDGGVRRFWHRMSGSR